MTLPRHGIHQDHLGSTSITSNTSGASTGTIKYFPYGDRLESQGTLPTDKLYTSQRLDSTGLYYYGARFYDPTIGRFISADTIVPDPINPQSLNRYSYCLNNPLKYIDPTGCSYEYEYWIVCNPALNGSGGGGGRNKRNHEITLTLISNSGYLSLFEGDTEVGRVFNDVLMLERLKTFAELYAVFQGAPGCSIYHSGDVLHANAICGWRASGYASFGESYEAMAALFFMAFMMRGKGTNKIISEESIILNELK